MKIRGKVVYEPIEGGFWGIVGDDGNKYAPLDELPERIRKEGTRIEADIEPVEVVSFRMWGRNVRVRSIKPV